MTARLALIDTNAIVAVVIENERHHPAAKDFLLRWFEDDKRFLLPDLVFVETMNLLRSRFAPAVAIAVGQELRSNRGYIAVRSEPPIERDSWAIFQRYQDKSWSYTDCHILALARSLQVPQVFTFDHHFQQMPEVESVP